MRKLKTTEVAATRLDLLQAQAYRCGLCKLVCEERDAVLDHCHTTGAVRATLHRSCNALLGKVENNYRRYGVNNLAAWATGMPAYLQQHAVNRTGLLHPTHKTDEEKRLARNAKARKARAARKVQ
jgi:hypothetical protein